MAFIRAKRREEATLNLGVKLREGNAKVRFFVLNALSRVLDRYIQTKVANIERRVKDLITSELEGSFSWQSVLRGELNQLLEIKNAQPVLAQVKRLILGGLTVKFNKLRIEDSNLSGGISVTLNVDSAKLLSALGDYEHLGEKVNWLRWILTGQEVNIFNLNIDYEREIDTLDEAKEDILDDYGGDKDNPNFLKENPSSQFGFGIVGLPIEFRGDLSDNFITRSLSGLASKIEDILKEEISP